MVAVFQDLVTSDAIKTKAMEFGADLVGIADGAAIDTNPPYPNDPRGPSGITDHDADRVIVLARRINLGSARIPKWNERHKFYNDELTISILEQVALDLVLWLEDRGYPALIVPTTHVEPWRYDETPEKHLSPILSMEHAAVEAGLGTLGLNLQLLTPEYGPRVMLSAVLSSVPVEPDSRMEKALCLGPECGRCLSACPGDVIGQWDRDWPACDTYRNPHGFNSLIDFLGQVMDAGDAESQRKMLRTEESFNLWQSILRGAGAVIGCRRCQDVCPVGADYESMLKDALDEIAEDTPDKQSRLRKMSISSGNYEAQARWVGKLGG